MDKRKKKILIYGAAGLGLALGAYGLYRILSKPVVKPVIKGDTTNSQGFDPATGSQIASSLLFFINQKRANG